MSRSQEDGATYLFADRFQYAQLGTLLTHAAIIVFILSAVVQRVDAYSSPLFLAEGSTLPVFAVSNPNQMQVTLENAYAEFAPNGQPIDYRADFVIYDRGIEAKRCSSTVNSPCSYNGYRFYQEAYFGYGATLSVRDTSTGNLVYQETLALAQQIAFAAREGDGQRRRGPPRSNGDPDRQLRHRRRDVSRLPSPSCPAAAR